MCAWNTYIDAILCPIIYIYPRALTDIVLMSLVTTDISRFPVSKPMTSLFLLSIQHLLTCGHARMLGAWAMCTRARENQQKFNSVATMNHTHAELSQIITKPLIHSVLHRSYAKLPATQDPSISKLVGCTTCHSLDQSTPGMESANVQHLVGTPFHAAEFLFNHFMPSSSTKQ